MFSIVCGPIIVFVLQNIHKGKVAKYLDVITDFEDWLDKN